MGARVYRGNLSATIQGVRSWRWVVVLAGLLFVLAGLSMLGPRDERSIVASTLGALLVSVFAMVASWVAFGGGERQFKAITTVSEWSGRVIFGIGAIALLAMAAWAWWRCYKLLRSRRGWMAQYSIRKYDAT
jgi:hypothetical protein